MPLLPNARETLWIGVVLPVIETDSAMDPRVTRRAERRLKRLGVSILARERITKVFPTFVLLESGEKVRFDVCIWTGGVKPSPIAEPLPLKKEPQGRLEVAPDLAAAEHVFVIGDVACLYDTHRKAPAQSMARPAIMEGRVAAANIVEAIKMAEGLALSPKLHAFRPRRYPYIVPVGGKYAITKTGPFVIAGFPAWIFKGIVELNYFLSIMPMWKALKIWLKGFFVFIRNGRLG